MALRATPYSQNRVTLFPHEERVADDCITGHLSPVFDIVNMMKSKSGYSVEYWKTLSYLRITWEKNTIPTLHTERQNRLAIDL